MICSLITAFCLVGGYETGPYSYTLEILDTKRGEILEFVVPSNQWGRKMVPEILAQIWEA